MEPNTINQFPPNKPLEGESAKSYGAVIASIIIILILVVGGLYFWGKTLSEREVITAPNEQQEGATTSSNDSVSSLDTDLNTNSGNLDTINTDLKGI